jgi:DNA-binding CsgD family transcriptional regulator
MFENGRTSAMDAERSGRPSTSTTDEKLEEARAIILADRRVTIEEIALQLGISQGTAYSLVHDIERGIISDQDPMANFCVNGFESCHSITNFHF